MVSKKKKKKKKKVFTKIDCDFSAGFVTFRLVGGDASQNGAELFEIGADYPPHPPPQSPTAYDMLKKPILRPDLHYGREIVGIRMYF